MARGHAPTAFQHNLQQTAGFRPNAALHRSQQQQQAGSRTLQPNQNNMQKLSSRICVRDDVLESLVGVRLSAGVANELKVSSAKAAAARVRAGDKSDRATVEQALDPRTRMVWSWQRIISEPFRSSLLSQSMLVMLTVPRTSSSVWCILHCNTGCAWQPCMQRHSVINSRPA
jgi:hypothetical protein